MKLLRETVRKILLENNHEYYETLASLFCGPLESIRQAIDLAESIGLIQLLEDETEDEPQSIYIYHHLKFKCLEEDFGPYIRDHKNKQGGHRGVHWDFMRRGSLIRIMVIDKKPENQV